MPSHHTTRTDAPVLRFTANCLFSPCWSRLDPGHVLGLCALRILNDLKFDRLTFGQRLKSVTLDRRKVDEYVRSTLLLDEPETLLFIEPLHCSACHVLLTSSGVLLKD